MKFLFNKRVLLHKGHTSAQINLPHRFVGRMARIEITIPDIYCVDGEFIEGTEK